jgi:poly(hydroxyalkanoate) depolymerase family esterase
MAKNVLKLLRRWFKKGTGAGLPLLPRPRMRSRFIEAGFFDPSGAELRYRLYLPSGASRRDGVPLLVMLHGCRQASLVFSEGTRMNALAEEGRCAVLYPQQSERSNPLRCWNWFEPASLEGHGEAALIANLIVRVTRRRPIDSRRVSVVGMSAGAAMACLLAVRHSRLFAACAIHSGLMYGAATSSMQAIAAMQTGPSAASIDAAGRLVREAAESQVSVPTLVIHGDRDTTVNPVNADRIIEQLKARAEFIEPSAGTLVVSGERRIEGEGRAYRQQDYAQQGGLVLRRILIEGLGHAWSGGDGRYDFNDAEGPEASRLILDFVRRHQRDTRVALISD